MNKHVYGFENVVIGYSLSAVQYAYHNEYPIILNSDRAPFAFDMVTEVVDNTESLSRAEELWSAMLFSHGMKGLVPFGSGDAKVNITGNRMLVSVRDSFLVGVEFKKCFIFEDDFVTSENNVVLDDREAKFRVIDWIDVRVGSNHHVDELDGDDDFVKTVYFYPSSRVDGNHNKKDCVSVSYMGEEEINQFEYSDTMVKFKVQKMMVAAGITGAKKGFDAKDRQRISNIKLEPKRRVVELLTRTRYEDTDCVRYMKSSEVRH